MRYVMETEWPNMLKIEDANGEIFGRAAHSAQDGVWLLISWLDRTVVTSGPSLAGLLIDAGFEGVVDLG